MDAQTLITCWEHGRRRHPLDRALLLYAAAAPHEDPASLADRPLGARNAALLRLRQSLFGDALKSCVDCPACGERLEFILNAAELLSRAANSPIQAGEPTVTVGSHVLRLPTTRDLACVAAEPDESSAASALLRRLCMGSAPLECSAELEAQISRALDDADPCMDLGLEFACPACAHRWSAPLDVSGYLWDEIDTRVRGLLDEVHAIARSYSWSEQQILQLSETRRRAYLERVLA
jgi:hypothetical protein